MKRRSFTEKLKAAVSKTKAQISKPKANRTDEIDHKSRPLIEIALTKPELVRNDLKLVGIGNPYLQAGILSVIKKESNFTPRTEYSYKNTSNKRLRSIFVTKLRGMSDDVLTALKQNDVNFFNHVYGGRAGNTQSQDGYKFRGRAFNQLTGRGNYESIGDSIGLDLIKNPELANELGVASKISASYFKKGISQGLRLGSFKQFGVDTIEDINTPEKGLLVAFQTNAGLKTPLGNSFFQNSIAKTSKYLKEFLQNQNKYVGLFVIAAMLLAYRHYNS